MLTITRDAAAFAAQTSAPVVETRVEMRSAEIRSSLFGAADDANLPDAVTLELADVFGGDIDFYHDLRRGDRFTVVYETRFVDGEPAGAGRILAAEFVNRGVSLHAYLWTADDGTSGYYDENGRSLRKAFLRSPLAFSRITSGFTIARFHPILQNWSRTRAPTSRRRSARRCARPRDGVVMLAGTQTGYGNVIMLQHDGTYSTVYAHLSRFAPACMRASACTRAT